MVDPLIGMTIHFAPAPPSQDDGQAPRGGLGSQVLPVAELDDDFEGDPEDGSQYLFLVRREAAAQAMVRRVENPYAAAVTASAVAYVTPSSRPSDEWREAFLRNFQAARQRMLTAPIDAMPPVDPGMIPPSRDQGAWRVFVNGKRSKAVKTVGPSAASKLTSIDTTLPTQPVDGATEDVDMNDLAAAKATFLASLELDAPSPETSPIPAPMPLATPSTDADSAVTLPAADPMPEYERLPQLPSPALLVAIPGPALMHLVSHFDDWFVERIEAYEEKINYVPSTIFAPPALRRKAGPGKAPTAATPVPKPVGGGQIADKEVPRPPLPTAHESHWLLSVLTRLEQLLDGEDMSSLRQLAKTLASMAEVSEQARAKRAVRAAPGGRTMKERLLDEDEAEGRARCWMIVAAIAGVWAQADLWDASL